MLKLLTQMYRCIGATSSSYLPSGICFVVKADAWACAGSVRALTCFWNVKSYVALLAPFQIRICCHSVYNVDTMTTSLTSLYKFRDSVSIDFFD